MAFRSHLVRPMDLSSYWNRAIMILTPMFAVAGAATGLAGGGSVWPGVVAAGAVFLTWALTRELDPDRQVAALMGGLAAGVWALAGYPVALLPLGGFLVMARILAETTGRRPLTTDLIAIALGAAAISFTRLGFIAGFGIAVAIWVDERMAQEHHPQLIWFALITAVGATVVASLTGTFPEALPGLRPIFGIAIGVLALIIVVREPPPPTSLVDSRRKTLLRQDRVHAARSAVALIAVVGALVSDLASVSLTPVAIALAVTIVSSELERRSRLQL